MCSVCQFSEFPVKELSHERGGKHTVTVHGVPRGRKAYIQWGAAWFPKGTVDDTAVTTPVPCSLHHDTFHLGLGRPEPPLASVFSSRVRLKPDGTPLRTGGEVKGKLANGVGSQYSHTTSELGVSSITVR